MNPKKCIAYNSYYTAGMTPLELRQPMGTRVYGCDRCQEVCPRNQPWMNQDLPDNPGLEARADDFALDVLLTMSQEHYVDKVWPMTFYISRKNIAKWRMNAARALGNLGDRAYTQVLAETLAANQLWSAGVKPIVIGCGQLEKAHGPEESVAFAQVRQAAELYYRLALNLVRSRPD